MMKNKRGPWSQDDKDYIAENCEKMSHTEIAEKLQRNPKAVLKYMKATDLVSSGTKKISANALHVEYDIKNTPHWKILKNQFTTDELEIFLYHWNNTIKQFRDDVVHTEELQIIDMIKLNLLTDRLLREEKEADEEILRLQELSAEEKKAGDMSKEDIWDIDRQVANIIASKGSITRTYKELLQEKNKSLDKLKATREARVKDIEAIKTSMTAWLREIVKQPEVRHKWGMEMEKHRIAADVEFERLSEYHEYEDGTVDQPFLTPDNTKGGK